ncbi:hypothetical protein RB201_35690 [Streptomyces sp. S1A(2023)]
MPVLVEAGWGGLVQAPWSITWTDITSRVDMVQGISVTRGASDELSETQPGTMSLTLDNQDGALTPGRSSSPFFPFVRRNAPIRYSNLHYPARTGAGPWPIAQLTDDFDNGVVNPAVWTATGGSAEGGGRLRQPVTSTPARHTSTRSYSLTGSSLAVKLCTLPGRGRVISRVGQLVRLLPDGRYPVALVVQPADEPAAGGHRGRQRGRRRGVVHVQRDRSRVAPGP